VSKHATAGTSGSAAVTTAQRGQRLGLVQRCELGQPCSPRRTSSSTSTASPNRSPAVHHAMADGVDRGSPATASPSPVRLDVG
jgi:hypothetical protein